MTRYKTTFFLGLGMIGIGIITGIFTKDLSTLWISGSGATIVALALMLERLTIDWNLAFGELNGKFHGTTEAVRGCYADIQAVKDDIGILKPDNIEELKMRIENLEAVRGLGGFGKTSLDFDVYKPKPVLSAAAKKTD